MELQDAEGRPIALGLHLESCRPLIGDDLDQVVRWKYGSDLSAFAGKPVRLRFRLKDADVYSLRFRT